MTALSRRAAIRTLAVFFVVATLNLPALGSRRINVRKLQQTVADIHGQADPEASRLLLSLELTERLSPAKLRQIMTLLPGRQSRQSLTALADASTFLKLPADDLPALPALGKQAQAELLSHASAYVDKTLAQLPNFFATEAITLFEDNPPSSDGAHIRPYRPIHFQSRQNATVLYRGGKEVMETRAGEVVEKDQIVSAASGLLSSGEFGPVLSTVLTDAKKGKLAFSHWENTRFLPHGGLPVFRRAPGFPLPRQSRPRRPKQALPIPPRLSRRNRHRPARPAPSSASPCAPT